MTETDDRICLGAFAGAHGVKGDALIKTFTDSAENIASYGPLSSEDGARQFEVSFIRETKPGFALIRSKDINTREDAANLKGMRLYVARDALPPPEDDEFYMVDLIGLSAFDESGEPAGMVAAVHNFGAGDLIELVDIPGVDGVRLIPFTKKAIPTVSLRDGRIVVTRSAIDDIDADVDETDA